MLQHIIQGKEVFCDIFRFRPFGGDFRRGELLHQPIPLGLQFE